MSGTLTFKAGERGQIHVFAVNRPAADLAAALDAKPKADLARELLRAPHLDTSSTELFALSELSGVGLAAYLSEGYAVDAAQIAPDRARLDALDGYVLLLFSDSFHGKETQLTPGADVTLIGSYGEFRPDSAVLPLSAGQIPGMGLGLTMVRQMLWEAGGECLIQNRREGQGVILEMRV